MKKKTTKVAKMVALPNTASALVVAEKIKKHAEPLIKKLLNETTITTEEEYQLAATRLSDLKALGRAAEEEEKKFTTPLNALLRTTRDHFRPFKDRVMEIEQSTKAAMVKYLQRNEAKKEALDEKFEAGKIGTSTLLRKQEELTVGKGDATARRVKVVKILDENVIPREYLAPNLILIREALKEGKKVKGCELVEEFNIAI